MQYQNFIFVAKIFVFVLYAKILNKYNNKNKFYEKKCILKKNRQKIEYFFENHSRV